MDACPATPAEAAVVHIRVALDAHTDGIVNATKKGSAIKCPHLAGWSD